MPKSLAGLSPLGEASNRRMADFDSRLKNKFSELFPLNANEFNSKVVWKKKFEKNISGRLGSDSKILNRTISNFFGFFFIIFYLFFVIGLFYKHIPSK